MAKFSAAKHCGGKKKQGPGKCTRPKGWGTNHPGRGKCKLHGGATPSHGRAAEREAAEEAVATYGLPREIDPLQALLEEVYRTAGHVFWLEDVIHRLESDELVSGVTKTSTTTPLEQSKSSGKSKSKGKGKKAKAEKADPGSERVEQSTAVSVWVRLYQAERAHLARVSKVAIDAGIEERLVRIAEQQAQQFAHIVRLILIDLGHDPEDEEVRKTVRFRLIDGGKSEAA